MTLQIFWKKLRIVLHKLTNLLIHGANIIQYVLLSIIQLSEETQEAKHKDFKEYRNKNNVKDLRTANNEDTFYRIFLTFDPLPSLRLKSSIKNHKILDSRVIKHINKYNDGN